MSQVTSKARDRRKKARFVAHQKARQANWKAAVMHLRRATELLESVGSSDTRNGVAQFAWRVRYMGICERGKTSRPFPPKIRKCDL
jgi:hypothetical protein